MSIIEKLLEKGYEKQVQILKGLEQESILMITQTSSANQFRLGESMIGGIPHVPEDFLWPEFNSKSLVFLAQINLEEINKYDKQELLPKSGLLYFFHEGGEDVWGFDPRDKGGFRAIHISDTNNLKPAVLPDNFNKDYIFSPCKLVFERIKSYPTDLYEMNQMLFDGDDSDDNDEFFDIILESMGETINKMFGYPDLIQGDIFLESQLVTNGLYCGDATGYNDARAKELEKGVSDWILLFQLDSDDNANMMWGDVGRIYFTVRKEDLAIGNFDNIWSAFQCG